MQSHENICLFEIHLYGPVYAYLDVFINVYFFSIWTFRLWGLAIFECILWIILDMCKRNLKKKEKWIKISVNKMI